MTRHQKKVLGHFIKKTFHWHIWIWNLPTGCPTSYHIVFGSKLRFSGLIRKELSFCHKLRFSNSCNFATHFPRPLIFQTINSGRSNSLSLKYQRFTPSGCKDIGVRKCKFVAKTQFLYQTFNKNILIAIIKELSFKKE